MVRRRPCWPGPYSRRLTGLFGRPQTFCPIRRSILYFASWRLVIASSCLACSRIAPSSVPDCRNRQVLAEAADKTAGRETQRRPEGPRGAGVLGAKRHRVKPGSSSERPRHPWGSSASGRATVLLDLLIDVDFDGSRKQRTPRLHRGLHARIAGDALAGVFDELVRLVFDFVHEPR